MENTLVTAFFLSLEKKLTFRSALEIVKNESKDINITNGTEKLCLGCKKIKCCYGDDNLRFCSKCILPEEIYQKYLSVKVQINKENPELLDKLNNQLSMLVSKR